MYIKYGIFRDGIKDEESLKFALFTSLFSLAN